MDENDAVVAMDVEPEEASVARGEVEDPVSVSDGETASDTVRDLIVKAYPDVVPELIQGATLEEMLTTLPAAQDAYQNIADDLRAAVPEPVPSGGGIRSHGPDLESMSAEQKIKLGIGKAGNR